MLKNKLASSFNERQTATVKLFLCLKWESWERKSFQFYMKSGRTSLIIAETGLIFVLCKQLFLYILTFFFIFIKWWCKWAFFYKVQYSFLFNYSLQLFCFVIFHRKFKGTIFAFFGVRAKKNVSPNLDESTWEIWAQIRSFSVANNNKAMNKLQQLFL